MKKIIAFAGTTSKASVNKKLAAYATTKLKDVVAIELLDLNDFELPLYSIDKENEIGIPEKAKLFSEKIAASDGVVVSFAEHNGNFTVAFKNLTDWISRLEGKVWKDKKMLLLSTSPGARGGESVMGIAKSIYPYQGGVVVADFSLPSFFDNFKDDQITNQDLDSELAKAVAVFEESL